MKEVRFQAGVLLQRPGPDLLLVRHLPPDVERRPRALVPHRGHRALPRAERGLGVLLGRHQGLRGRPLARAPLRQRGAGRHVVGGRMQGQSGSALDRPSFCQRQSRKFHRSKTIPAHQKPGWQ